VTKSFACTLQFILMGMEYLTCELKMASQ